MKKLTEEQIENLECLLEDFSGTSIRSYSGRAMYGKECLGIEFDDMSDAFTFALLMDDESLTSLLSYPKFDSMGLGIIAYWTNVEAPEGVEDDEDEYEEV